MNRYACFISSGCGGLGSTSPIGIEVTLISNYVPALRLFDFTLSAHTVQVEQWLFWHLALASTAFRPQERENSSGDCGSSRYKRMYISINEVAGYILWSPIAMTYAPVKDKKNNYIFVSVPLEIEIELNKTPISSTTRPTRTCCVEHVRKS